MKKSSKTTTTARNIDLIKSLFLNSFSYIKIFFKYSKFINYIWKGCYLNYKIFTIVSILTGGSIIIAAFTLPDIKIKLALINDFKDTLILRIMHWLSKLLSRESHLSY